VVVVALVAYPLSFGPACWAVPAPDGILFAPRVYLPLGWVIDRSPGAVHSYFRRYLEWWLPDVNAIFIGEEWAMGLE